MGLSNLWRTVTGRADAASPRLLRALDAAVANDATTVAQLLDAGLPIDAADSHGRTLLYLAARQGHADLVAMLVRRGALLEPACRDDPDGGRDAAGDPDTERLARVRRATPLLIACCRGHSAVVDLLLGAGADLRRRAAVEGDAPDALQLAAAFGRAPVVERLLAAGADVHRRTSDHELAGKERRNALSFAGRAGHDDGVRILVAAGADAGSVGGDRLYAAVERGDAVAVAALLKADVPAEAVSIDGRPVIDAALRVGDAVVLRMLEGAGVAVDQRWVQSALDHADRVRCDHAVAQWQRPWDVSVTTLRSWRARAQALGWRELAELFDGEAALSAAAQRRERVRVQEQGPLPVASAA